MPRKSVFNTLSHDQFVAISKRHMEEMAKQPVLSTEAALQAGPLPESNKKRKKMKSVRFEGVVDEDKITRDLDMLTPLVSDVDDEEADRRHLAALLDALCMLAQTALEYTLSGNDADFKGYDIFKYELASVCVDSDSVPDELATDECGERLKRQELIMKMYKEMDRLDPAIEVIFASRLTSAPRRRSRLGMTTTLPHAGLHEYGLGISETVHSFFMEQAIKRGIEFRVEHQGGSRITDVGVRFIKTGGVIIPRLVRECVINADRGLGRLSVFKRIFDRQVFVYSEPGPELFDVPPAPRLFATAAEPPPEPSQRVRIRMSNDSAKGTPGDMVRWDWSLRCARSSYQPIVMPFIDGSGGSLDSDSLVMLALSGDNDLLEYFQKMQKMFVNCGQIGKECLAITVPEDRARKAIAVSASYVRLCEFYLTSTPTSPSAKLETTLMRQTKSLYAHACYYAAAFSNIAGDYHTAIGLYRVADQPVLEEYGKVKNRAYLNFMIERVYMVLCSLAYMPEACEMLVKIQGLISTDPRQFEHMRPAARAAILAERHEFSEAVQSYVEQLITFYNANLHRYDRMMARENECHDEWQTARMNSIFDSGAAAAAPEGNNKK